MMMHYQYFVNYPANPFDFGWTYVLVLGVVWEAIWKALGLWRAGRNNHLGWFIAIFIVNSVGILPILYLVFFADQDKQANTRKK